MYWQISHGGIVVVNHCQTLQCIALDSQACRGGQILKSPSFEDLCSAGAQVSKSFGRTMTMTIAGTAFVVGKLP